jgi:XTP/dITP diphosphohydrolase
MKLLVATTNRGKLREIAAILRDAPVELVTLESYRAIPEPEETGSTFAENARLKALYYSHITGIASVADDSGLEIDALDKAPGVQSARWHGTDYKIKFQRIYELLREKGVSGSTARFVCSVALADRGRIVFEATGTVEGEIAPQPRGAHGFGYDPIFYYPPSGKTLGEIELDEKGTVSHRGKAFAALREYLVSAHRIGSAL